MPQIPGLFITGTHTDVGKTVVATRIVQSLARQGKRVGVYKPVASGCRSLNGDFVSDDAVALWNAANRPETLHDVCPQRFAAPLAPHVAAEAQGRTVDDALLRTGLEIWQNRCDCVIVEGAGGLMSPLSHETLVADLAWEFGYPLVLVVANQLGALNQALMALQVAKTYRGGLAVAAVVLNDVLDPAATHDASRETNFAELKRYCSTPLLKLGWNQTDCDFPAALLGIS